MPFNNQVFVRDANTRFHYLFNSNMNDEMGSYNLTATGSPTYTTLRNCMNGVTINGSSQYGILTSAGLFSSDTGGTIEAIIHPSTSGTNDTIIASCDTGSDNRFFQVYLRANGAGLWHVGMQVQNAGAYYNPAGTSNSILRGYKHYVVAQSNGTAWSFYVNGIAQTVTMFDGTNIGDWFADVGNRDNLTAGVFLYNGATKLFYNTGETYEIHYTSTVLTAQQIKENWYRFVNNGYEQGALA